MAHGERPEEQILPRIERRPRWSAPKLAVRLALVFGVLLVGAALISPHEHPRGTAAVLWGASVTWHHAHQSGLLRAGGVGSSASYG